MFFELPWHVPMKIFEPTSTEVMINSIDAHHTLFLNFASSSVSLCTSFSSPCRSTNDNKAEYSSFASSCFDSFELKFGPLFLLTSSSGEPCSMSFMALLLDIAVRPFVYPAAGTYEHAPLVCVEHDIKVHVTSRKMFQPRERHTFPNLDAVTHNRSYSG